MTPFTLFLMAGLAADPPPPEHTSGSDDPQTIRMRIDQNMKATEEQLRRLKVADEARRLQDEVLRDIDRLLNLMKQPPQTPPEGKPKDGSTSNPPPDSEPPPVEKGATNSEPSAGSGTRSGQQGNNQQTSPGGGGTSRERRPGEQMPQSKSLGSESRHERRARAGRGSSAAKPPTPMPGEDRSAHAEPVPGSPGNRPGEANGNPGTNPDVAIGATMPGNPARNPDRLADMSRDVWGHLPETLRQEVDHYYRERFMPRYRELLQQYYNRLAESEKERK